MPQVGAHMFRRLRQGTLGDLARKCLFSKQQIFLTCVFVGALLFLQENIFRSRLEKRYRNDSPSIKLRVISKPVLTDKPECDKLDVVVKCITEEDIRNMTVLLKSILYTTRNLLKLHLVTNPIGNRTLAHLFHTWNLQQVDTKIYFTREIEPTEESLLLVASAVIENNRLLKKLAVMRPNLLFTRDILELWYTFKLLEPDQPLAWIESQRSNATTDWKADILLVDCEKFTKKNCLKKEGSVIKDNANCKDRSVFEMLTDFIDNSTNSSVPDTVMRIEGVFDISSQAATFPWEAYRQLVGLDGDLLRVFPVSCGVLIVPELTEMPSKAMIDCELYMHATRITRRTHLYYHSVPDELNQDILDPNDVTLVVQLQLNRIYVLLRMLQMWDGPASIAIYITDAESLQLHNFIQEHPILTNKARLSFHVVYQRLKYYPINYLRNIAIRQVKTPYMFVLDADFVIKPGLYSEILSVLAMLSRTKKRALVVPVFETMNDTYLPPALKAEFVQDIQNGTVEPYHQLRGGWKFGHSATNYATWVDAKSPYMAKYNEGFEPYMVLPTGSHFYHEELLERMRDKIAYTYQVFRSGYDLFILHDAYAVHLPHPKSNSHMWTQEKFFNSCTSKLYTLVKEGVKKKYNDTNRDADDLTPKKKATKKPRIISRLKQNVVKKTEIIKKSPRRRQKKIKTAASVNLIKPQFDVSVVVGMVNKGIN